MSFLRVYSGDTLCEQRELTADRLSVGRAKDNDLVLENRGISKHHALIERRGASFVLVDNASANGVFVNGKRVREHTLRYWDEIQMFQYRLVFMATARLPGEADKLTDQALPHVDQAETVELDLSALGSILKRPPPPRVASVALQGAESGGSRYRLDRVNFTIGRGRNCDIRAGGWLAPKVAATIQRRNDGHYLVPSRRGRVLVNGQGVRIPVKLADDDDLQVRGLALKFLDRPDISA